MTIHPLQNIFEMSSSDAPRYSIGLSVLVIFAVTISGWAAIGLTIYSFL